MIGSPGPNQKGAACSLYTATSQGEIVHSARYWKRSVASGLILLLLFMQAVTAAYACPQMDSSSKETADAMPGCQERGGGMDQTQPLLCKASCEQILKTATPSLAFDAIPAAVVLYVLRFALQSQVDIPSPRIAAAQLGEPPPGWPPLYLFHRILRN